MEPSKTVGEGIVLGVIPARGGSRRVHKKNLKILGGKPLVAWTIEQSLKSIELDYCLVSTDDIDIMKISKQYGANVPFRRPSRLAIDCDSSLVLQHAVEWYERQFEGQHVEHVVCLQPTSPFRNANDIDNCVQLAKAKPNAETIVSVVYTSQHPYWCFELTPQQQLIPMLGTDMTGDNLVSQNLPPAFYPNGAVYVTRRDVLFECGIYGQKIYGYHMPRERSIDLEEEFDFLIASSLIQCYGENVFAEVPRTKTSWLQS